MPLQASDVRPGTLVVSVDGSSATMQDRMVRMLIVALILCLLLVGAGPAHAHGVLAGPPEPTLAPAKAGSAEAKLRRIETRELGAAHAAVHAFQRQLGARLRQAGGAAKRKADATLFRKSASRAAPVPPPDQGGSWEAPTQIPVIAIHAIMLPTGKVLMFAYPGRPGEPNTNYRNLAHAYLWDPVTKDSKQVDPPIDPLTHDPTDIWCGAASLLADGRVLVTGGNVDDPLTNFHGINTVFTFDPFTETWARHQAMRQGRWYPTQLLMPDGRTVIVGGNTGPGDPDYGAPSNLVGGPDNDVEFFSPDGTIRRDGLRFNTPGGPPMYPLYPRLLWMPSGRVMSAGPYVTDTWFLKPAAPGGTSSWTDAADLSKEREWGNVVLLPGGRVLTLGGSPADIGGPPSIRPATNTAEMFDENRPAQGWAAEPNMAVARSHANSVLLPDGKVATIGGGFGEDGSKQYYRWLYSPGEQTRVELRDPATGSVTLGASQAEGRTYHSTALLLPDARVMSAGDDINGAGGPGTGVNTDTAEIYSPPYLFTKDGSGALAPRPRIQSAPAAVQPGDRFEVGADGPAATRAVLVAPGAATHAFDMSQRFVELAAPQPGTEGRTALRMPADVNVAPPGYYMLFLLSADGVPSIARFVRLDPKAPPQPAPPVAPSSRPPEPPPAPAKVTPKLKVSGRLARLRTIRRTRRFSVVVGISEPGTVVLSALLDRANKAGLSLARRKTMTFATPNARRVTFTLTRAGLRRLSKLRRGVLRIRALARLDSGRTLPVSQTRRRLR
ncbi:MAG: hypothetical protein QOK16_2924 [Solirubrobacteraceae bacterium]|nr:hypothetical protein [Solirubrobacteraceae bacterium]